MKRSIQITSREAKPGDETEPIWQVTRFCCTSGMCIECRAAANGTKRNIVVHADKLTKAMADRMAQGWASYAPEVSRMPVVTTEGV